MGRKGHPSFGHYDNKEHWRQDKNHYRKPRQLFPKSRPIYPKWSLSERATERLVYFLLGILATRLLEILVRIRCG